MKHALVLVSALLLSAPAFAAKKTYQASGTVSEITDTEVTIDKGKEKWTIKREAGTKVNGGDLKKGAKVTIYYTMAADEIEVKAK